MYGEAMTNANHSQDELSWKNLKALLKKQGIEAHADGIGNTRFSYKDGDENIFLGDKEAYLQTCYSCEVHYSISKKMLDRFSMHSRQCVRVYNRKKFFRGS